MKGALRRSATNGVRSLVRGKKRAARNRPLWRLGEPPILICEGPCPKARRCQLAAATARRKPAADSAARRAFVIATERGRGCHQPLRAGLTAI